MLFEVGKLYSRKDVCRLLRVPLEQTQGNWFTGYTSYNGEHFVFVNIETAGRTGHAHGDHWTQDHMLYWHGKVGSNMYTPTIQKMIAKDAVVHIFTRDDNRNPHFVYRGIGRVHSIENSCPVQITWAINKPE